MDGHGEFGHKVSGFLRTAFPKALFAEPSFATDVPTALREAVRQAEAAMLQSNYQVLWRSARTPVEAHSFWLIVCLNKWGSRRQWYHSPFFFSFSFWLWLSLF
jgi:hypothetical protein